MLALDTILRQFHKDLRRAEDLVGFIDAFRKFAASSPPQEMTSGTVAWEEAATLRGIAPAVRTDLPILSGAILLYVCGRFEYFAREIIAAIADNLASNVSSYSELPEKVRLELHSRTLEIAQAPSRYQYSSSEAESLVISLAKNLSNMATPGPVEIMSRVLTVTESNMGPKTLADLFKRVGITDLWTDIGKQARLKSHLSTASDRECSVRSQSALEELMKERNGIAHPSGTNAFPGPERVLEGVTFLKVLSQVLVEVVQVPRTT